MPENFKKTLVGPVKRPNGKSMPKNVTITLSEVEMQCSDGLKLKGQMYDCPARGNGKTHRILCLHGGLDNCRSYYYLAPELIISIVKKKIDGDEDDDDDDFYGSYGGDSKNQDGVELYAPDLPGHGYSDHGSADRPPMLRMEFVYNIAEALALANWWQTPSYKLAKSGVVRNADNDPNNRRFMLIGHSLGNAIGTLYTAAFPEQVERLVMLDSLGFVDSTLASDTVETLRAHVDIRQNQCNILDEAHRFYYSSYEDIFEARVLAPKKQPGKQSISREAVKEMLTRGIEEVPERGFRFLYDPRLNWVGLQHFTQEQIDVIYTSISSKVCVVLGQKGWPQKVNTLRSLKAILKPVVMEVIPGSHCLHADPKTADRVVKVITKFFYKH